jgi:hypothetical protein
MFPKRGQVYASGRRYGNRFIEFIYTVIFYGIVLFFVSVVLSQNKSSSVKSAPVETQTKVESPSVEATEIQPAAAISEPSPAPTQTAPADSNSQTAAPVQSTPASDLKGLF